MLAVLAVFIGFAVSFCLLVSAAAIIGEPDLFSMAVVCGLFGLALFTVALRGAWGLVAGPLVHVVSFEQDRIVWGYVGEEKSVESDQIASIDWAIDSDSSLTLSFRTTEGKRVSLIYIDQIVSRQQRPVLLSVLQQNYPAAALTATDAS